MRTRAIAKAIRTLLIAVAVTVAVVGMGSVLAVSLAGKFGDTALGMKTGSMRPVIRPGDLVLVRAVDPAAVHVGNIITFRRPNETNEIYTHRVESIRYTKGGQIEFKTKGDTNGTADPWTVSYAGPAMEVVHVIRHGGLVLHVAQSPDARLAIALSIFVLVLALLWPVIVGPTGIQSDLLSAAGAG